MLPMKYGPMTTDFCLFFYFGVGIGKLLSELLRIITVYISVHEHFLLNSIYFMSYFFVPTIHFGHHGQEPFPSATN